MPFDRIVRATVLDNLLQKLFTPQSTSCNCYHGNQRHSCRPTSVV